MAGDVVGGRGRLAIFFDSVDLIFFITDSAF